MESDLRRKILDTTRHLMVQDGYKGLSMRKIARAIGYSATSIYLHFESKDALFHALIDEGMGRLYEALSETADAPHEDAVACLQALCERYIQFGLDNPEYYEVMFMLHPEHMERYPAEKYRRARRSLDLFADVLSRAAREGAAQLDDARVWASTTWAALHGTVALLLARRVDVRIDPEAFVGVAVEQVVRSVTYPSEQATASA